MAFKELKEVVLQDILDFSNGKKRPKEKGDIPVYGGNGILDYCNQYNSTGDSIIIGRVGAYCGNVYLEENNCWISDNAIGAKVKENMSSRYMYYKLKHMNLHNTRVGSSQPLLTQTILKQLTTTIHEYKEQKAIANILSTLDDKIEVNNKINQKLEEMAQAIFKQWFIDFDFPNEEGKPYKSSGGEMIESELGMIPNEWEVDSLSNIANYLNGLAMQKFRPENEKESLKVLKIKELRQGRVDENSDLCSDKIDTKYIIKDGDIIFSWSGSLLVDIWCGGKCGLNQHLFKVTSDNYSKWFYYLWTKYHLNEFIKIAESKATTMGHIKRSDIDNAKVLVPRKEDMEKANQVFDSIIEKIVKCKSEVKKIEKLRDILLPKLMSGEIRVQLDK